MSENRPADMIITIDDGSRRVPIRNLEGEEIGAFTFHPTDIDIIRRYNALAEEFDGIAAPLDGLEDAADLTDAKCVDAIRAASERLYRAVDALLGSEGAAAAFFGQMNPFSPVDGEFYCTRVLNAVGEYIGAQFETETKRFSERGRKYVRKGERRG